MAVLIALPFSALADTNTQTTIAATAPAATTLAASTIPPLLQHVRDAKQMLAGVNLNANIVPVYRTVRKKKVLSSYTVASKDAALAVWDPNASKIAIITGTLKVKTFAFKDPNIDVDQIGFNGVNTRFHVNSPAGGIVLALKYLISNPDSGSKAAVENGLQQVVYVPYSPELNTYDLAQAGDQYLNGILKTVTFQLGYEDSVSVPGENITEAIKPSIIKALIYAEHMDTSSFVSTTDVQSLINQLNVSFAVNEGDTFKYSVSSGNARGIAQFLPSTYLSLVNRHPNANLIDDAVIGLSDHVNSIKAEYLLIDDYIAAVHARIGDDFNPADIYDYGAASYNGGVARVAKAVETFGDAWNIDNQARAALLQSQINGENAAIKVLKGQISKTKLASDRKPLQAQLADETANLTDLKHQLSAIKSSGLHTETIMYLVKMHSLIQVFNSQQS